MNEQQATYIWQTINTKLPKLHTRQLGEESNIPRPYRGRQQGILQLNCKNEMQEPTADSIPVATVQYAETWKGRR